MSTGTVAGRVSARRAARLDLCIGFRVDSTEGRVGTVKEVLAGDGTDGSEILLVQTGLFLDRLVAVPASEVETVSADRRRVVLRTSPEGGFAEDLRQRAVELLRPPPAP